MDVLNSREKKPVVKEQQLSRDPLAWIGILLPKCSCGEIPWIGRNL